MAVVFSAQRVPYTGPYAMPGNQFGHKSAGPTVEAMKRALSRAGAPSLPWRDFNQTYNADLETAWDWFDKKVGAGTNNNGYGEGRWKRLRAMKVPVGQAHAGENALDSYGIKLIQDEAGETSDNDLLTRFQNACVEFCNIALAHPGEWRYNSKIRPVQLNVNPANPAGTSDCSGSVIQIADYARRKAGLINAINDPSKQNWSGYGNTDQYEDDWPKIGSPFRIGDLAHFHSARHVTFCIKAGNFDTAEWWSFGSEPPVRLRLRTYYRFPGEYMFTVRPDYLKEGV